MSVGCKNNNEHVMVKVNNYRGTRKYSSIQLFLYCILTKITVYFMCNRCIYWKLSPILKLINMTAFEEESPFGEYKKSEPTPPNRFLDGGDRVQLPPLLVVSLMHSL